MNRAGAFTAKEGWVRVLRRRSAWCPDYVRPALADMGITLPEGLPLGEKTYPKTLPVTLTCHWRRARYTILPTCANGRE